MIRALKVTMVVYAVIGILVGLAFIFVPRLLGAALDYEPGPAYVATITAALGASFIAACVYLIAAARDPVKHILWVKYAITFALLMFVVHLYAFAQGYSVSGHPNAAS